MKDEEHQSCPGKMKKKTLIYICKMARVKKCVFFLLLMFILMAVYVVFTFDLISSADYTQFTGCSEEIYNFPTNTSPFLGDPVFGDLRLRNKCQAEEEKLMSRQSKSNDILDKCGKKISAKLLSYKKEWETRRQPELLVPNIVHYVSLGKWKFSFLNYISFRSVHDKLQPDAIYIHGDGLPFGDWWDKMLTQVANVYYVMRDRPVRIQGRKVGWLEHSSDVIRLQTLLDNGGIYLDTDIIVLKSFDPLRQYPLTLGRETSYGLGSGIILSQPHSRFVCIWIHGYRNYNPFPWNWATYAVWVSSKLALELPEHIHIEEKSLQHPSWLHSKMLYDQLYDWTNSYAMHIWKRYGHVPENPDQIKALNSTLGEVMRFIYYGSKDLILDAGGVDVSGEFGTRWSFSTTVDLVGHRILEFFGFNT